MSGYHFRRMADADLPMLAQWLKTPDWRRWWGEPETELANLAADLHEPGMRLWIVSHGGTPFAFLQDYDIHALPEHPYRGMPPGSFGIDQSIGMAGMIGRGHGSAFIRCHAESLLAAGAPCIVTDPHPENARAIRAYEKAGFTRYRDMETAGDWGPVLLMVKRN